MYKGLYDTREGLSKKDAALIGTMTATLLLTWDRWVHRRVERATFCDEDALLRNVSVDFTLPDWFHQYRGSSSKDAKRQLVPVGFLRKGVLVNFSLQDEANTSLPLLTAPQNAQVAEATLWVLALEAFGQAKLGKKVLNRIKCDIRSLVREPSYEANQTYFRLLHEHDSAWKARELLDQNPDFVNVASLFREHFLALSMLKIAKHERRVLHLSYEESVWDGDQPGLTQTLRRGWALATGKPRVLSIGVPSASETESYHIEVEAPDGLMITARESYYQLEDGTSVERKYTEGSIQRAHFHFTNILPNSLVNVAMYLRPRRSTIVRGATLTALLALAATMTITFRLPTESSGSETATALLLAITGVIGLVVVRGGEDEMATSLLFPLRVLAVIPVVLSVAAALVIVAHPSEALSRVSLALISVLMAISIFFLSRNWYFVRKVQQN